MKHLQITLGNEVLVLMRLDAFEVVDIRSLVSTIGYVVGDAILRLEPNRRHRLEVEIRVGADG